MTQLHNVIATSSGFLHEFSAFFRGLFRAFLRYIVKFKLFFPNSSRDLYWESWQAAVLLTCIEKYLLRMRVAAFSILTWFLLYLCEKCLTRSFILCTPHQILFGWPNREDWGGRACNNMRGVGGEETFIQRFGWETWKEAAWKSQELMGG
jgi:hypothetical protein